MSFIPSWMLMYFFNLTLCMTKLRVLVLCFSYFKDKSIGLLFIRDFLGERRVMYHLFLPLDLHYNKGARMNHSCAMQCMWWLNTIYSHWKLASKESTYRLIGKSLILMSPSSALKSNRVTIWGTSSMYVYAVETHELWRRLRLQWDNLCWSQHNHNPNHAFICQAPNLW
jgi:hypothetical protein